MEKSKVYFTSFKTSFTENLMQKLARLVKTAGIETIDFQDHYAAIKIHFGEYGNLAFLRPNYAKVIADIVKEQGGKPFLTDCNTLYVGSRKNAVDHLETAYMNGFTPYATGCPVIIADGLKGTDEALVPVDRLQAHRILLQQPELHTGHPGRDAPPQLPQLREIGRASCRERV